MVNDVDSRLNDLDDCLYRVSVRAIIVEDGKLLLSDEEEEEGWFSIPGGGLDHGEDALSALARELDEEIGLHAAAINIHPEIVQISHKGVVHGIPRMNIYYRVQLIDRNALSHKEIGYRWVTKAELQNARLSPGIDESKGFLLSLL